MSSAADSTTTAAAVQAERPFRRHRASTQTIVSALRILAADIRSDDGVANAAILEAAERLSEMAHLLRKASGAMSHERWSTAFRKRVKLVV